MPTSAPPTPLRRNPRRKSGLHAIERTKEIFTPRVKRNQRGRYSKTVPPPIITSRLESGPLEYGLPTPAYSSFDSPLTPIDDETLEDVNVDMDVGMDIGGGGGGGMLVGAVGPTAQGSSHIADDLWGSQISSEPENYLFVGAPGDNGSARVWGDSVVAQLEEQLANYQNTVERLQYHLAAFASQASRDEDALERLIEGHEQAHQALQACTAHNLQLMKEHKNLQGCYNEIVHRLDKSYNHQCKAIQATIMPTPPDGQEYSEPPPLFEMFKVWPQYNAQALAHQQQNDQSSDNAFQNASGTNQYPAMNVPFAQQENGGYQNAPAEQPQAMDLVQQQHFGPENAAVDHPQGNFDHQPAVFDVPQDLSQSVGVPFEHPGGFGPHNGFFDYSQDQHQPMALATDMQGIAMGVQPHSEPQLDSMCPLIPLPEPQPDDNLAAMLANSNLPPPILEFPAEPSPVSHPPWFMPFHNPL